MSSSDVPSVLVRDGFARVDASGRLSPANEPMRELLRAAGRDGQEIVNLDELPCDEAGRAALRAGEPVALTIADRGWSLRCSSVDGVTWLTAVERTAVADGQAALQAAARARALADIAGSIAHDLNNQFSAVLGLATQIGAHVRDAGERRLLDDLVRGTRVGAQMLAALAKSLRRARGARERVSPGVLLDDALAITRKTAHAAGIELAVELATDVPEVNTVAIDAAHALLQGLLAVLACGPQTIRIDAAGVDHALAGGRVRRCARVAIVGLGVEPGAASTLVAALGSSPDALVGLVRSRQSPTEVLGALLVQRRLGGDIVAGRVADRLQLDYYWPAAAPA